VAIGTVIAASRRWSPGVSTGSLRRSVRVIGVTIASAVHHGSTESKKDHGNDTNQSDPPRYPAVGFPLRWMARLNSCPSRSRRSARLTERKNRVLLHHSRSHSNNPASPPRTRSNDWHGE
jgi:hypothetical protein